VLVRDENGKKYAIERVFQDGMFAPTFAPPVRVVPISRPKHGTMAGARIAKTGTKTDDAQ
jgi:hypothetical protein